MLRWLERFSAGLFWMAMILAAGALGGGAIFLSICVVLAYVGHLFSFGGWWDIAGPPVALLLTIATGVGYGTQFKIVRRQPNQVAHPFEI